MACNTLTKVLDIKCLKFLNKQWEVCIDFLSILDASLDCILAHLFQEHQTILPQILLLQRLDPLTAGRIMYKISPTSFPLLLKFFFSKF